MITLVSKAQEVEEMYAHPMRPGKTDNGCLEATRPLNGANEGLLSLIIGRGNGNLRIRGGGT